MISATSQTIGAKYGFNDGPSMLALRLHNRRTKQCDLRQQTASKKSFQETGEEASSYTYSANAPRYSIYGTVVRISRTEEANMAKLDKYLCAEAAALSSIYGISRALNGLGCRIVENIKFTRQIFATGALGLIAAMCGACSSAEMWS